MTADDRYEAQRVGGEASSSEGPTYGYGSLHFYDLTNDWLGPDQPEVRFYLQRAREADRVVEIGAGTGRIALELAAEGIDVYCVEPSAAMRSALLTKVAQRPETHPFVTVLPASGETFDPGRTVPLVFADKVLQHLMTDDEMLALLRNVRSHLDPEGFFLFSATAIGAPKEMPPTVRGERRVGEMLYRTTFRSQPLSRDYFRLDVRYETLLEDRVIERNEYFLVNRYVRRETMYGLLKRAGLEVSGEFEAYKDEPFTGGVDQLVMEARRSR